MMGEEVGDADVSDESEPFRFREDGPSFMPPLLITGIRHTQVYSYRASEADNSHTQAVIPMTPTKKTKMSKTKKMATTAVSLLWVVVLLALMMMLLLLLEVVVVVCEIEMDEGGEW